MSDADKSADSNNPESDNAMLDRIASVGKSLTSTLNLPEVQNALVREVEANFQPGHWALLLVDEDRKKLRFEVAVGQGMEALQGTWMDLHAGLAGSAFSSEGVIYTPDSADLSDLPDLPNGVSARNGVAVRLHAAGRTSGVLTLFNLPVSDGNFGAADQRLLGALADFAGIAIDNALTVHRIRELTVTDDVTSLYNARYLQQALDQEYKRSRRYKTPTSVIFIDLDYFKTVNDNYGHLVGSSVLRETAEILRENLRATDIPTRYGGDEFVIILPETPQEDAMLVARRCLESMHEHTFGVAEGHPCQISASFGLATLPDDTNDPMELIRLADQAMYYVKEHGRDAIATASEISQQSV